MCEKIEKIAIEALTKIVDWPDFYCERCGWSGSDPMWTDGCHEYPNDIDPFCPKCGRDNEGTPMSYVDEFDPKKLAKMSLHKIGLIVHSHLNKPSPTALNHTRQGQPVQFLPNLQGLRKIRL